MSRNSICLLFVALFIASSCSNSGDSVGSRTVVVLTPDEVGEIVLPPDAFENEVLVTLPPSTTNISAPTEVTVVKVEKVLPEVQESSADDPDSLQEETSTTMEVEQSATTTTTTSTTTTTTTTQPTKVTIPIAEEEENAGVKLMDTLDDFNS